MTAISQFEIFLSAPPGLEQALLAQVTGRGFKQPKAAPGGVTLTGGWPEVWRANLWIRGAGRVLARLDSFPVNHLAVLDRRARQTPWAAVLRPDIPVRVEATCTKSRIYHAGAAAERIETAIRETLGAPISDEAEVVVHARLDHDVCTLSVDTSGEHLHKRGFKTDVNAAPMRETLASLFLTLCGYDGTEPVLDPMCGSGTFVIEAAEIAAGLNPGRARAFAFEKLVTFDAEAFAQMRAARRQLNPSARFHGSDRDARAIAISRANAERAGVTEWTVFRQATVSEIEAPEGPHGLVIVNPPYGARLGDKSELAPLYRALGQALTGRFRGWRIGLVTSEPTLARATGLPFMPPGAPVPHGGLRVTLYQTAPLG
jgi:putative N6-adenine-specific DNA methylase